MDYHGEATNWYQRALDPEFNTAAVAAASVLRFMTVEEVEDHELAFTGVVEIRDSRVRARLEELRCVPQQIAAAGGGGGRFVVPKELNLSGHKLSIESAAAVARAVAVSPFCESVRLQSNQLGADGCWYIAQACGFTDSMVELNVSYNDIGSLGMQHLATHGLATNRSIQVLKATSNNIGPKGIAALAKALETNSSLRFIDLTGNNNGDNGKIWARNIAHALRQNRSVELLFMGANRIGDAGAQLLSSALKVNDVLYELQIPFNNIGEEGGMKLANNLRSNCTLTALDIQGNPIGDRGVAAFAALLKHNRCILELNLQAVGLSEASCRPISEMIDINTTLATLYLGHNDGGGFGQAALRLKRAIHTNATLRRIGLQNCGIAAEDLAELRTVDGRGVIIA